QQVWIHANEILQRSCMAEHIAAKGILIEKLVRDRSEVEQVSRNKRIVNPVQVAGAFQHSIEQRMHQHSFDGCDGHVAFASPQLIELRLYAVQAARDRRRVYLVHGFENHESLTTCRVLSAL